MTSAQRFTGKVLHFRLMAIVCLGSVLLDQLTKTWIAAWSGLELGAYPPYGGVTVLPGFFSIVYSTNTGAAWGLFSGYSGWLALLGLLAVAAILYFHRQLELERRPMQFAFGLMTGGILGNFIDRAIHGHVIDVLDFHLGSYHWPTFNVADMSIDIGVALYIYFSFRSERAARQRLNVKLY
jgi:signal peptidase II